MKKFFLMLAVALPMFFLASCGDDDNDLKDDFSIPYLTKGSDGVLKFNNSSIYLEWDDSQAEVKQAMNPYSYVLYLENNNALAYTYDAQGNYPIYAYAFVYGNLNAASITISVEQDDEIDFEKYFKDNGYKDITPKDEEEMFIYQSKDKVCIVTYEGDDQDVMATWVPNETRSDLRAVVEQQREIVKAAKAEMGK